MSIIYKKRNVNCDKNYLTNIEIFDWNCKWSIKTCINLWHS